MGEAQRVFLSHTSELAVLPNGRSFVDAARSAVERAGDVVVHMSTFPPAHLPAEQVCRERVRSCGVLVLIAGFRHGSTVPHRPATSYVELEFDVALALDLPRIVVLVADDPHGPDAPVDEHQAAFRARLRTTGITATVSTPDALETAVLHALTALVGHERPDRSGAITAHVHKSSGVQIGDGGCQINDFTGRGQQKGERR